MFWKKLFPADAIHRWHDAIGIASSSDIVVSVLSADTDISKYRLLTRFEIDFDSHKMHI